MKPIHNAMKARSGVALNASLPEVRPWTPTQIFAIALVFGMFAGSMCLAVNYARMNQHMKFRAWLMGGFVLSAITTIFCVVTKVPVFAGPMIGLAAGYLLMSMQQPDFEMWRAEHWDSITNEPYKPNSLGLLLVCVVVSCGLQVTAFLAMLP